MIRILIVEDDENISKMLAATLSIGGYTYEQCADGVEAAARIPEGAYDLVLLDVMLPGLDGFAVLDTIRAAGCESVSAAMLLNDCGFDVTVDEFIDAYLPLGDAPYTDETGRWLGCDPWEAFPGDPRTPDGWGCYSTVIEGAMNRCLAGSGRRAKRLSGVPLDELCAEYIDRGQPVLLWATIDMEPPVTGITWTVPETGREITWIYPMHCLVLIGYDADSYIFNDPWAGECIAYDKESVELAYTTLYEQAIVLP